MSLTLPRFRCVPALLGVMPFLFHVNVQAAPPAVSPALLSHANDHGFMWWAYGWRGRSPENTRVFCIQTNRYGLAFDVDRATLTHLGGISKPLPEAQAVSQSNAVVFDLPAVGLVTTLTVDGRRYIANAVAPKPDQVRIVEHGRFFQRIEMLDLQFRDEAGAATSDISASYEIVAWPDRLAVLLHVTCEASDFRITSAMSLSFPGSAGIKKTTNDHAGQILAPGDEGLAVLRVPGTQWVEQVEGDRTLLGVQSSAAWCEKTLKRTLALVVLANNARSDLTLEQRVEQELAPRDDLVVRATGIAPYTHPLESAYDAARGYYRVRLGDAAADGWTPAADQDRLERVAVTLQNPSDVPRTVRIAFSQDSVARRPGIIGMSPMLRDSEGCPIGLPVQISKNWHKSDWFNGTTMFELPPHSSTPIEFTMCYARWGGVPAVSHAQLCLIGWGVNQLWHEVAIGSFGESICYDPDVNLNRAMIDDMRPLLVRRMGSRGRPDEPLGWTNNVGGGDFLVYINENGRRQFLSRMRTAYTKYCPNLAEVTYAGQTQDGRIDARITVSHYRSDDITRGLYHLRYDVKHPAPFKRIAFFQLGADHYNDHQFRTMARGDFDGVQEEWQPSPEGSGYARRDIECGGATPWFSLHDAVPNPKQRGAWANRGLIVLNWRARLGGRDSSSPIAGIHHTRDHVPSVLLELTAPSELTTLEPGDYVEAEIEMIVLPMTAADYLGPNVALREALGQDANTWRMVWREAVGNRLNVEASPGIVERQYPTRIRCDDAGRAEFTIHGGVGYLPVTVAGVRDYRRCRLERRDGNTWRPLDQSVHGNDFWQTDYDPVSGTWEITFNVPADRTDRESPLIYRLAHNRRLP